MKKSDKTNRNITFMLFIFLYFSTSFDLRLLLEENFLKVSKRKYTKREPIKKFQSVNR